MIHFSNAQTTIQKLNTATLDNIDSLFVSNLYTSTNGIKHIFTLGYKVKGDGGTAHYVWNPQSSLSSDSVFAIKPKGITGNGRWELIVDNGIVNFSQIGGISNSLTDCKPVFRKFLSSKYSKLYIPANVENDDSHQGPYYRFNDSITIKRKVEIFGDGKDKTVLAFPNSGGFYFKCTGSSMHDLKLKGVLNDYGSKGYNGTKHGIYSEGVNTFNNLFISSFGGDGMYIYANSGIGSNANNAVITNNIFFWNGRNGLTIKGPDANQIEISHNDATLNKRWGFADSSFLGNISSSNHAATNGTFEAGGFSAVVHHGYSYYCTNDNIHIEPGVTQGWENYWLKDAAKASETWNSSTKYYSGGGYCSNELNHQGSSIGDYVEGDEKVNKNYGNLILGGFRAQYGQAQGAIGLRQGIITLRDIQAFDESTQVGVHITKGDNNSNGFIGFRDQNNSLVTGMNYDQNLKAIRFSSGNEFWVSGLLLTRASPPSLIGRKIMPPNGAMIYNTGVWLPSASGGYRMFGFATESPTSGEYATGDFLLNNGPDNTIIGWKCTTGGNPGTWVKIKSGN